jgi:arsenite-transporting ATPase
MLPELRTIFFIGKGGVGKTTISTNLSLDLSEDSFPTHLLSIDPANNLYDYFAITKDSSIKPINNFLAIEECDIESKMNTLINKTIEEMKSQYKHLTILNLENLFNAIKFSPGINEYLCLLTIYDTYIKIKNNKTYFLIDSPPTGLFLQMLSLLKTSKLWLKELITLREKIIEKRFFLDRFKNKTSFSRNDTPIEKLKTEATIIESLETLFSKSSTKFCLIINNDNLSMKEGEYIISKCNKLDISIDLIIVNKFKRKNLDTSLIFKNHKKCVFPQIESLNSIKFNRADIKKIIDLLYP